jgi:hypothetical protein
MTMVCEWIQHYFPDSLNEKCLRVIVHVMNHMNITIGVNYSMVNSKCYCAEKIHQLLIAHFDMIHDNLLIIKKLHHLAFVVFVIWSCSISSFPFWNLKVKVQTFHFYFFRNMIQVQVLTIILQSYYTVMKILITSLSFAISCCASNWY